MRASRVLSVSTLALLVSGFCIVAPHGPLSAQAPGKRTVLSANSLPGLWSRVDLLVLETTTTTVPKLPPPPLTTTTTSAQVPDATIYQEWTRVANCEEGGWVGYSGPAYPDSLGISAANWYANGGGSDLSPAAQIAVAQRIEGYSYVPDQYSCHSW
jgi:hypothetical protein